MPRAKYDENNPYNILFFKIGYFKTNYPDFLYDFRYIYQEILNFYGDMIEPIKQEIEEKLEIISQANVKPSFKNRFYIVTGIDRVVLAVVDIDEAVFDNLVETFDFLSDYDEFTPDKVNGSLINDMYLFKGNKLVKVHSLTSFKLAEFMAVFKNENIVNYQGARDEWYAKPRRKAKRENKS
ncbi:MAG: hypothetical protein LIO71_04685 [Ruminococcus sp.]|nr:hypothetical protein [Ruminococcus sp.]